MFGRLAESGDPSLHDPLGARRADRRRPDRSERGNRKGPDRGTAGRDLVGDVRVRRKPVVLEVGERKVHVGESVRAGAHVVIEHRG